MHIKFNPFPALATNRLQLWQLVIDDKRELFKLRSDEQVNKYLGRPAAASLIDAEAFIFKIDGLVKTNVSVYWAISLTDQPALIGTICLWNFVPEKNMAEIGYELLPDWQGQGLMQEALTKVTHYGFDTIKLKTIAALTSAGNESSVKLFKSNGFKLDEQYAYVSKDEAEGQMVYTLTASH